MPAPAQYDPNSRRSRVFRWFEQNPGWHRTVEVAQALDEETHGVAVAARHLYTAKRIERRKRKVANRRTFITEYGLPKEHQTTDA